MTKADIVNEIAKSTGIDKVTVLKTVEAFMESVKDSLSKEENVYFLLNKPRSIICSVKDEHDRKTVVDLIATDKRIYPVGRLDYDTTGLIILTNDGNLANTLMHPTNDVPKKYIAKLNKCMAITDYKRLKEGIEIDGIKCIPTRVKIKKNEDKENKTSLYIAISDTIFIANIKNTFTRIQTIAHECLHSIQNRRMLMFNFYYSNIYLVYFALSIIFTISGVFKNYNLQVIILLLMSFVYYVVRAYLETDAMLKAKYVAENYMKEYIKQNKVCTEKEVEEISEQYDKMNKLGIPAYNFILISNTIIKVIVYIILVIILNLIR